MLPEEEEGGLGGGGGGAMSIGDPLASGASGDLGGGGGGGASLSGMLINDSASVSTELDQLINNMDGNGFVNEGTGEIWHAPSVDNPNFASEQSLQSHFDKHATQQGEFGNITEEQYVTDAKKLVTSKPGGDILTYTRSNGDTLFYNKANNEFAVVTNKGVVRTFFKPADGIEYFNNQR